MKNYRVKLSTLRYGTSFTDLRITTLYRESYIVVKENI